MLSPAGDNAPMPTLGLITPGGGLDLSRLEQLATMVMMVSARSGATELNDEQRMKDGKVKVNVKRL